MSKVVEIQSVMTLCPHSVGRDQDLEAELLDPIKQGFHLS